MKLKTLLSIGLTAALSLNVTAADEKFNVVGSSTVFPFSKFVADELKQKHDLNSKVESTGSGGGHKIFSKGEAEITNSSRRMKLSEFENNQKNDLNNVFEAKIGYDGIAIANSVKGPKMNLTLEQLFLAVAKEVPVNGKIVANPYKKWSDIDKSLPSTEILVLGPPTTSGTRDAFHELVLHKVVKSKYLKVYADALFGGNEKKAKKYQAIRNDGAFSNEGENDGIIVKKLANEPSALGIFGYSFLVENPDTVQGSTINGVAPTPKAISSGEYPISRSLFFYVDLNTVGKVEGAKEYCDLFFSETMIGTRGLLKKKGLIPLPKAERMQLRLDWKERKVLTADSFQK